MKSAHLIKIAATLLCGTSIASAGMISLDLKPPTQDIFINGTANIELWAKSTPTLTEVFGIQVIVAFDNTKLQYLGTVDAGVFDLEGASGLGSAVVWSGQNLGANAEVSTAGVCLTTLQFKGLTDVQGTNLSILPSLGAVLTGGYDILDNDVPVSIGSGATVNVVTPEPDTALLFGLLSVVLLCIHRHP